MKVKLHRCRRMWNKVGGHPCWRVQRELDAAGVVYEIVPGPVRRSKRDALEQLSGQRLYPVIEFPEGRVYRAESGEMAQRIRSSLLFVPPDRPGNDDVHDLAHEAHGTSTESM
jgi:hypothetical protein